MDAGTESFDPRRRFVRVTNRRPDGFVEFAFAIGDPELFVELLLRSEAFDDFCRDNQVEILTDPPRGAQTPDAQTAEAGTADDGERDDPRNDPRNEWNWTMADAREIRFR